MSKPAMAADHGVILLYHHVSNDTPSLTSVTPAQFQKHLDFIANEGFQVVSLSELLQGLSRGADLPDNAVAITFDDAYESVYAEAFPRLKEKGWPFTVFVADHPVDQGFAHFMSWTQMRDMAINGVEFGGHSTAHEHLVRKQPSETAEQWRTRVKADIAANRDRLQEQLAVSINSFAWPYGESTNELEEVLRELDLFGLGQQSGPVGSGQTLTNSPRFPMMSSLASIERLSVALNSRPLPVSDVAAGPSVRRVGEPSGELRFRVGEGHIQMNGLACYSGAGKPLDLSVNGRTVNVTLPVFQPGRNKVNCTAPSSDPKDRSGTYYWYAQQWLVKTSDGSWYAEP